MDPSILIIMALAVGAMWLMTSRTRKQQKAAVDFRASLTPGQDVMTGSGLFGTIVAVDDDVVTLETSPGVTSRWLRPAIAKLVDPPVVPVDVDGEDDEAYDDEAYDEDGYDEDDDTLDPELDDPELDDLELDDEVQDETPEIGVEIPDDASSLTTDPDEDAPRR